MAKTVEVRSLGALLEAGFIEAVNGFPFGGHNENGAGIPHIRPFNVATNGEISLEQIKSIPPEAAAGKPRLRRGDVVFNNTNTKELVGKCALWDHDLEPVFSNHMTRIRVLDRSCDAAYLSFAILYHWMTGRSEMLARAHVAQASIMGERFREIEVPWRSAADQRVIAAALARVRESCRSELRQEEHTQVVKAAAMRELFTRGLRGEPQKETEIGPVPESWDLALVGDLATIVSKGASPKWQGFDYVNDGVLFVRSQNVGDGYMDWTEKAFLPPAWNEKEKRSVLRSGDVLINLVGASIGRAAVGGDEIDGANCNQAVCFVRLKPEGMLPAFLCSFLLTVHGQRQIHGNKKDIARANLSLEDVRNFVVPRPLIEEQREIVAILDAIDRKIDLHRRKRALLEELFKSLLHKLMTGEVRVADLDLSALPEPAAATGA